MLRDADELKYRTRTVLELMKVIGKSLLQDKSDQQKHQTSRAPWTEVRHPVLDRTAKAGKGDEIAPKP